MSETRPPCRLHVYLARDCPRAVVLRRGPSDWVRLSLWRTDSDEIEHGQWMRNRVYERRCDLSADGRYFVYFARGSAGPSGSYDPNRDSWVALSRPPWFTALALWFVGGTYYTGGCFPDGQSLWIGYSGDRLTPDIGALPDGMTVTTVRPPRIDGTPEWTDRTVWLNRLLRDGWSPVEGAKRETWQRPQPNGRATLLMTWPANPDAPYHEPLSIEYALQVESGDLITLGVASWADWDQRGRLVLARDGRLLEWAAGELREICDFNPQEPDPQPSPPEATAR